MGLNLICREGVYALEYLPNLPHKGKLLPDPLLLLLSLLYAVLLLLSLFYALLSTLLPLFL